MNFTITRTVHPLPRFHVMLNGTRVGSARSREAAWMLAHTLATDPWRRAHAVRFASI